MDEKQFRIKKRVLEIEKQLQEGFQKGTISQFIFNEECCELLDELDRLTQECSHEFKNGSCIYCHIPKKEV